VLGDGFGGMKDVKGWNCPFGTPRTSAVGRSVEFVPIRV
jgi:hypothetical protein